MGHEFLGEVLEVGADVEELRPGDRVVSPFTTSCGECFFCARGLTARCERGQLFRDGEALREVVGNEKRVVERFPRSVDGTRLTEALGNGVALIRSINLLRFFEVDPLGPVLETNRN